MVNNAEQGNHAKLCVIPRDIKLKHNSSQIVQIYTAGSDRGTPYLLSIPILCGFGENSRPI